MSVIINPRGTSGAGKTELTRRIMAIYGWGRDGHVEPVYRDGRRRPICYRLRHPLGGRPLAVLGHYEATSGGCDTIGGTDEVFRLAGDYASTGHDVLFEGLLVSREYRRSAALAASHGLRVLHLSTPLDRCVRNVIARRRARRDIRPLISKNTATEHMRVGDACGRLRWYADVQVLSFDEALLRAQELLGLGRIGAAAMPAPAVERWRGGDRARNRATPGQLGKLSH